MGKNLPILTWNGRILSDEEVEYKLSSVSSSDDSEEFNPISLKDFMSLTKEELLEMELSSSNMPLRERKLLEKERDLLEKG